MTHLPSKFNGPRTGGTAPDGTDPGYRRGKPTGSLRWSAGALAIAISVTTAAHFAGIQTVGAAGHTSRDAAGNADTRGGERAMLVLDASGSMAESMEPDAAPGQLPVLGEPRTRPLTPTKMTTARRVLKRAGRRWAANDVKVGMVAYGHRSTRSCSDIQTLLPFDALNYSDLAKALDNVTPSGKTPLSDALIHAARALDYRNEPATVVLLSDGQENCAKDPCAVARELKQTGADFRAHVIGFRVDAEARRELQCVARATGGQYTDARDADQLFEALQLVTLPRAPEVIGDAELILPELREGRYNLTIRLRDRKLTAQVEPIDTAPRSDEPAQLEPLAVRPAPEPAVPLQEIVQLAPEQADEPAVPLIAVRAAQSTRGLPEDGAAPIDARGDSIKVRGLGDRVLPEAEFMAKAKPRQRRGQADQFVNVIEVMPGESHGLLPSGPLPFLRMLAVDLQANDAQPVPARMPIKVAAPTMAGAQNRKMVQTVDDEPLVIGYGAADDASMAESDPIEDARPEPAPRLVRAVPLPRDEPLTARRARPGAPEGLRLPLLREARQPAGADPEAAAPTQVRLPEAEKTVAIWQVASLPGRRPQPATRAPADPPVRAAMPRTDVILEVLAPESAPANAPATGRPFQEARLSPERQVATARPAPRVNLSGRYDFIEPTPPREEPAQTARRTPDVVPSEPDTALVDEGRSDGTFIGGRYQFFEPKEVDDITDEALLADGIFGPIDDAQPGNDNEEPDLTIREARSPRGSAPPDGQVGPSETAELGSGAPGAVSSFPDLSTGVRAFADALNALRDEPVRPAQNARFAAVPDGQEDTATTVVEETTSTLAIEQRLEMSPPAARELRGPRFARIDAVRAGYPFKVGFTTAQTRADWVAIATPSGTSNDYISLQATTPGSELTLRAPSEPGTYEVRYISSINGEVLSRQGFTVGASSVSLTAQKFAEAGDELRIWWKGPGLTSDKVVLARRDMEPTEFLVTRPVIEGNPVIMDAPDEPGSYEVRYINGTENVVMFRAEITVTKQQIALALP